MLQVLVFVIETTILVKREAGENPARSRRCNGEMLRLCHYKCVWNIQVNGKVWSVIEPESEDLPVIYVLPYLRMMEG